MEYLMTFGIVEQTVKKELSPYFALFDTSTWLLFLF